MMRKLVSLAATVMLVLLAASSVGAADPRGSSPDEKALQKRAEEFVAAFNAGDAHAVAAFWTPDGDYVTEDGEHLKGRKAIEQAFAKMFAATKGAKLHITTTSLRFLKPDLAIEDGLSEVVPADGGPPETSRYTLVHVKQDDQWLLASVRDAPAAPPPHDEHLEALAWLVGDWADEGDKGEVAQASYSWAENDNFLVSSFTLTLKDVPVAGGTQWIGWDPVGKHLRSWSFASNGSFTEGVWSEDGNRWTIKTTATLPDGKKGTSTILVTKVDDDHLTWQSTKRSLDGKSMPDTEEVKLQRVKPQEPQPAPRSSR